MGRASRRTGQVLVVIGGLVVFAAMGQDWGLVSLAGFASLVIGLSLNA